MSCGVGRSLGLDLALLWLWHRLADVAPIRPLAWETPYAKGVALKSRKKRKKKRKKGRKDTDILLRLADHIYTVCVVGEGCLFVWAPGV